VTDTPCEVWFYHLERSALDQMLPQLLEKTLARGWRAVVRTSEPDRVEHLDTWLWAYRDDSFLPHGPDHEPLSERQPILLTTGASNGNQAQALFVVDGAEPGDISAYERCVLIFDGRDDSAVASARGKWSGFKAAGHPVAYWRQGDARGWEKQG